MNFHPHIHAVVLGGGLTLKNEWKDNGTGFFLPVKAVSKVFRGKYMDELKRLWESGKLSFYGTAENIIPSRSCLMPVIIQNGFRIAKKPLTGHNL